MKQIAFIFLLAISSCVIDTTSEIAYIKNNLKKNVIVVKGHEFVTDTILYYSGNLDIRAGESKMLYSGGVLTTNYVFTFFDMDTVLKYSKAGVYPGLAKKAFLSKHYAKIGDTIVIR
jgi:hypothetical protein